MRRTLLALPAIAAVAVLSACVVPATDSVPSTDPNQTTDSAPTNPGIYTISLDQDAADFAIYDGHPAGIPEVDDFSPGGAILTVIGDDRVALTFASPACSTPELDSSIDAYIGMPALELVMIALTVNSADCDESVTSIELNLPNELGTGPHLFEVSLTSPGTPGHWRFETSG